MSDKSDPAGLHSLDTSRIAGLSVLVVDDDEEIRTVVSTLLEAHGVQIRAASSTREALAALDDFRADIVVTDLNLTGRSGFDLLEELRRRGERMPVVLLTAGNEDARDDYPGFDGYLDKPVSARTLLETLGGLRVQTA